MRRFGEYGMKEYLAHSATDKYPSQTYKSHITGVMEKAIQYTTEIECYAEKSNGIITKITQESAWLHDLGKLEEKNQEVLRGEKKIRHLPINHVDAGSAVFLKRRKLDSAVLVYSHHKGLPDISTECGRGANAFRDRNTDIKKQTDLTMEKLLERHQFLMPFEWNEKIEKYNGEQNVFFRMILSCLADADHTDTAEHYGKISQQIEGKELRAKERLEALNQYVSTLGGDDERSYLRREMYEKCRDAEVTANFSICDSPVGSGKTTAVMAHLLRQAIDRKARRIFVVLPYTSIIQQSVNTYRKALVLPGEKSEEVVAELHSRVEFEDYNLRYLTSLWRAPIIVTTAVAFFETIASNRPSTLRKFHELPGSIIFIDEAHNALPLKLLPLAWEWMNILAKEWSCYWVLASGSFVHYWKLESLKTIKMLQPEVQNLVDNELRERLMKYEQNRVEFHWKKSAISRRELVEWVQNSPGPRLLVLNTVQSAAVIADELYKIYGKECVEHLSTALTPEDRENTINRIQERLDNAEDVNWTLVATSCVEAGVDFSFRTGFREISSLLSLLQVAGRINRHGCYQDSKMWSFSLQEDSLLKKNPAVDTARGVLMDYFSKKMEITPELSTQSMNDEIIRNDSCIDEIVELNKLENARQFASICEKFKVIDSNTVLVIIDEQLAEDIKHEKGDWQTLQRRAVSIRLEKEKKWNLKRIVDGIFLWTRKYDTFLGYMRGVLDENQILEQNV